MSKYENTFQFGEGEELNIDAICNDWNEQFIINTWVAQHSEEYNFFIVSKDNRTIYTKIKLSRKQALEIIKRLDLVFIREVEPKPAGSYRNKEFVISEIARLQVIMESLIKEYGFINDRCTRFKDAIKRHNLFSKI